MQLSASYTNEFTYLLSFWKETTERSVVYTRWGKKTCPSNAELVLSGNSILKSLGFRLVNSLYIALHHCVLQGSDNNLHMCFATCKMHLACHITCIYMICKNSFKILILNIVCHILFSSKALFQAIPCSLIHILYIFCYLINTYFVRLFSFWI